MVICNYGDVVILWFQKHGFWMSVGHRECIHGIYQEILMYTVVDVYAGITLKDATKITYMCDVEKCYCSTSQGKGP